MATTGFPSTGLMIKACSLTAVGLLGLTLAGPGGSGPPREGANTPTNDARRSQHVQSVKVRGVSITRDDATSPHSSHRDIDGAVDGSLSFTLPVTAEEMLARLLPSVPAGVTITSVAYAGSDQSAALFQDLHFDDGTTTLDLPDGLFLCTGKMPPLQNTSPNYGWNMGKPGDDDLTALLGARTYDAAVLTITFTTDESIEGLGFRFVFASEEFPESVNSSYNDGFGVFLDGENISLITIRNAFFSLNNTEPPEPHGNTTLVDFPIEYDGMTGVLVTQTSLQAGEHTLKLAIADALDATLDSAVFLAELDFGVICSGTGTPPELSPIPEHVEVDVTDENEPPFVQHFSATDTEPAEIIDFFTVPEELPAGMTLTTTPGNPATGQLAFKPSADQFGESYTITIYAIDDTGTCDSATIRFHVTSDIDPSMGDLTFEPQPPVVAGTNVRISAAVHYDGLVPATCMVEFYLDGLPGEGGVLIDVPQGPLTVPGTAAVTWNTAGIEGVHQIIACITEILPDSGDIPSNNCAEASCEVIVPPDLELTACIAPSDGDAGQDIDVSWTVTNIGGSDAEGQWFDRVYLSSDGLVRPDEKLGEGFERGPLAVDEFYAEPGSVPLPEDRIGGFWIVVVADADGALTEVDADNNARVCGPITIHDITEPETTITAGPADGERLNTSTVSFEWSGTDNGTPTEELLFSWCREAVATGCDPSVGPFLPETAETFTGLAEEDSPHIFRVAAQDLAGNIDSTPAERTFWIDTTGPTVVECSPGGVLNQPVSFGDVTFSEEVEQFWAQAVELIGPDGPIAVNAPVPLGENVWRIGFATQSTEGKYWLTVGPNIEDLAGNTMPEAHICSFTIAMPNLIVSSVEPPGQAVIGQPIDITWTVTNDGNGLAVGGWQDCTYLSSDAHLGDDTLLCCVEHPDDLEAGVSYDRDCAATLPAVSGNLWIVACADARGDLLELDETDNCAIIGPIVPVGPNLTISDLLDPMPTEGWTCRPITVGWTVTNTGDVPAEGSWQDCVYLSDDGIVGDDDLLDCMENPGDLDVNEPYDGRVGTFDVSAVPEGEYWIVVKANDGCAFAETDCTDNDAIDGPFPMYECACADLEPGGLVIPSEPVPAGGEAYVDWVVTNIGDGPTDAPFWYERVYLSSDDQIGGDWSVDFQNPMALNPGESYPQDVSFTVPISFPSGDYYVIVETDATNNAAECDETNNIVVSSTLRIDPPPPAPTLKMTNCEVDPPDPSPGNEITVTWTITNTGGMSTGPFTIDHAIVLSEDDVLDYPGDRVLDWHVGDYSGDLDAGETSEPISAKVDIPLDVWGAYHIIVWPDPPFWVDLARALCTEPPVIDIQPPFPSDLEIDELVVPANGISGQPVDITWMVRNAATETTNASWWDDNVYLSDNDTLDPAIDRLIGPFRHNGILNFDETYSGPEEGQVVVPEDILPEGVEEAPYYVFVYADANDRVYEWDEENNIGMAGPIQISYAAPDLQVEGVTVWDDGVPAESVHSGTTVTVEWTVVNTGSRETSDTSWSDRVYISEDDVLDGSDDVRATVPHTGSLAASESYTALREVTIPIERSGDAVYVFVCTDYANDVYESGDGNNCDAGDPFEVIWAPPDLQVEGVEVYTGGEPVESGSTVTVEWTVVNSYLGATATSFWSDCIYISTDDVLDSDDRKLDPPVGHWGALDPDETYAAFSSVEIPIYFVGPEIYILVETDCNDAVYEFDDDNNVGSADPIEVIWGPPDLLVQSISAPGRAVAGEPLDLSWTVKNIGGPTTAASWNDRVYVSTDDRWLDPQEDALVEPPEPHSGDLAYDATYLATITITLSPDLPDEFYLCVKADDGEAAGVVSESDEGNNGRCVPISLVPLPVDLQVTDVDAPGTALSGQSMQLTWTVSNFGIGATPTGFWRDAAYLSPDQYLDRDADYYLGYFDHFGILNPAGEAGDSYTATESVHVPNGLSGPYYVFVCTDIGNHVYEENEGNNCEQDESAVQVQIPPPADLVVTDIVLPEPPEATLGEDITIEWTVRNDGDFEAQGSWHDSVYISADTTWDIGDKKIGKIQHTGPLPSGAEYAPPESLTAPLPGVVPGDYYIIVRTDIHNEVRESIEGEQNNKTVSTEQINVDCWELALGVPDDSHQLTSGTEHYYKIPDVPEGETLLVTLDCFDDSVSTELYLRCGAVPDRGRYDFAYSEPFAPDHEIVVPSTQGGTCYVLVRGEHVPGTPSDYALEARLLEFEIRSITPTDGSNTASITVKIAGGKFEEGTEFYLVDAKQREISPEIVYFRDSSKVFATFSLQEADDGPADVKAVNPGSVETTAPDAFEVLLGGGPQLHAWFTVPGAVRAWRNFEISVAYVNVGKADMPAPLLELRSSRSLNMSLHPDGPFSTNTIRLLGVNMDGPAGVLPPGGHGSVPVYVQGTGGGSLRLGLVRRSGNETVDWLSEEPRLRPPGMSDGLWHLLLDRIQTHSGTSWGELEQGLANVATRLWQQGELVYDFDQLFAAELDLATEGYLSTISGIVVDAETEEALASVPVMARSEDGEVIVSRTSDSAGGFELPVPSGTYGLFAEGYYFDPSVVVDALPDQHVLGLTLHAIPVPEDEPFEPAEVPDGAPTLTRDVTGKVHMVWRRSAEVWHACFDGSAWEISGPIGEAGGSDLYLSEAPSTQPSGSVVVMWADGSGNDKELAYRVGKPAAGQPGEYVWAEPVLVTNDSVKDEMPALVAVSGQLMVVWLKKDSSIEDDTDPYYWFGEIGPLTWPEPPGKGESGARDRVREGWSLLPPDEETPRMMAPEGCTSADPARLSETCVAIGFRKYTTLAIPGLEGDWGGSVDFSYCASIEQCEWTGAAGGALAVKLGNRLPSGSGTLSGEAKYKVATEEEQCFWRFHEASVSYNGSGGGSIPMGPIPNPLFACCAIGPPTIPGSKWGFNINAGLGGSLAWQAANFPGWPSSGSVRMDLGGGPWGEIEWKIGWLVLRGEVSGELSVYVVYTMPQNDWELGGCASVTAEGTAGVLHGSWSKEWCIHTREENRDFDGVHLKGPYPSKALVYHSSGGSPDGTTAFTEEFVIEVAPLVGTGAVYPGQTVLDDVTEDLRNDGPAAVAVGPTGEIIAAWTRDSVDPQTAMGNSVAVASYENGAWSSPIELVGSADFNSEPQVVFDADGMAMVVWVHASAEGLQLDSEVQDILEAVAASDIVYSRRVDGVWSPPATLAGLVGSEQSVSLAADDTGRVLATWSNTGSQKMGETTVYAAFWDQEAEYWGTPVAVASSILVESISCDFAGDTPLIVWGADVDGDPQNTTLDQALFYATFPGDSWSSPVAFPKEQAVGARHTLPATSLLPPDRDVAGLSLPPPPEECCERCETDGDCNGNIGCTEDVCVSHACEFRPDDELCDDGEFCNGTETCDPEEGCIPGDPPCPPGSACNEGRDVCGCETDEDCDDGNVCNGLEYCDANNECGPGIPLDCGQSDECTHRWCDPGSGCQSESLDCKDLPVHQSIDPNEKAGPAGFGVAQFVGPGEDLPYTVRFENLPEASAPAQVVTVTDQLGANLDWRTFRIGDIAFGETVVEVPENRAHYSGDADLTDTIGLIVDIEAGINIATGTAEWTLTAIDPSTGELPEDPLLGLLPPNDRETHSGEGHVTFLIRALPDAPTGTEVTNTATIIFDINEPIVTNEVFNTVDSGVPTSNVTGPVGEQPSSRFEVCWTGEDDEGGSGIASYSIYYWLDGGPDTLWITTSDACNAFTEARGGGTYDFYSLATDNVGNIEAPPEAPDTTVTIAVQVPFAPILGTATATTVQLLDLGTANVGTVEHAVYVEEDGADSGYVGADGLLQDVEEWLPLDDWAGVLMWQLTPDRQYAISTKARSVYDEETVPSAPVTVTTSVPGDADGDGLVTHADVVVVQESLGTKLGDPGFDPRADLKPDATVTFADLGRVLRYLRGDFNHDGYVALDDFASDEFRSFHDCLSGPGSVVLEPECVPGDFDGDEDVDLADFAGFQLVFDSGIE